MCSYVILYCENSAKMMPFFAESSIRARLHNMNIFIYYKIKARGY